MSFELYVDQARDQTTLSRVMGLLGVASVFTALGAFVGPALGQLGFWVALIGAKNALGRDLPGTAAGLFDLPAEAG